MPFRTHHPFASLQVKADLQRSNDARDSLEQAVEEMKREIIAASATSIERTALQDEVLPPTLLNSSIIAIAEHIPTGFAASQSTHTSQIQSLQGRLVQALSEVRQLQLLCNEHEQAVHALELQLDAATTCDSERDAQLASALSAAAALQEERAALQQAREYAVLQGARAAAAAETAELLQSNLRGSQSLARDAALVTELQQCAARSSFPAARFPSTTPLPPSPPVPSLWSSQACLCPSTCAAATRRIRPTIATAV